MTLHPSITDTIGNTPLIRLRTIAADLPAAVALKLESHNPGGSVKDRVARNMIDDAEKRGAIERGRSVIVEPTSGNTGVGLAMVGAARGYHVIITMPESMSVERRTLLRAYGAELILTPKERGMAGAIEAAAEIAAVTDGSFVPGQFENPANPAAHYASTGPEIERALSGESLGAFVAGVGTGGTFTGVSRYLRDRGIAALTVAVEPAESPVIAQHLADEPVAPSPHGIQGIGAGFVPAVLDVSLIDELQHVTAEEAIAMARRLAAEEGVLVGISSGANVVAALRIAGRPELTGTVVITVAPSTGERYLSTPLWQGLAE